jgi:hypothetical protein
MFRIKRTKKTPVKPAETPAQMLKRVEAEIKAAELRDAYTAKRREENSKVAVERVETLSAEAETIKTEREARNEELRDRLINYGPLIVISALAIVGQFGYFGENLSGTFGATFAKVIGALCAGALESIALFLGLHAMKALSRKDSAAGLLFAATAVAGLVAWMNFTHFADDKTGTPTVASWAFGLFSFVAPFMWRIKIRSDHRDELFANGEIDKRGLKLGRSMLFFHPFKSIAVMSHAAWTGQRDPELAVKEWEAAQLESSKQIDETPEVATAHLVAMIENLRRDVNGEVPDFPFEVTLPKPRAITNGNGYNITHPKWNEGVAIFEASVDAGRPMKQQDLANELGMSNRVLAGQIQKYVTERNERKASVDHDGSDLSAETA